MTQVLRVGGLLACLGVVACLAQPLAEDPKGEEAIARPVPPAAPAVDPAAVDPLFGAIVPPGDYVPLTGHQRWTLFLRQTFTNPGAYIRGFGPALGDQIQDKNPEWGQGTEGYARRVAARYAASTLRSAMQSAGSAAMGLDPRYVPCQCTGVWHRIGHAVLMNFLTLNNNGHMTLNTPRLLSNYAAGAISVYGWYPDRAHTLSNALSKGNGQVFYGGLFNVVKEFSPQIKRIWKRNHTEASAIEARP